MGLIEDAFSAKYPQDDTALRILTNPFYAVNMPPIMSEPHETMITEDQFIAVGSKLISQIGPEKYLKNLLENLKGNFFNSEEAQ